MATDFECVRKVHTKFSRREESHKCISIAAAERQFQKERERDTNEETNIINIFDIHNK